MKMINASFAAGIVIALSSMPALSAAGRYELLLSGPVESVDRKANTINVVGHQIAVRDSAAFLPGYKINVFGGINAQGANAAIVQRTNAYAASGDRVMVTGKVTAIDSTRGRVLIDGANVDYTTLLARSDFSLPAVGDAVRVVGMQPAGKGTILASEMAAVGVTGSSLLQAQGVTGSSQAVGVTGSSLLRALGVTGSSQAVGVTGSSLLQAQGVTGSSQAVGVTGSSLIRAQGVTGSSVVSK
jgi:hypothetical protein